MLSKAGLVPGGSSYLDLSSWLHVSFLKVGDKEQKKQLATSKTVALFCDLREMPGAP